MTATVFRPSRTERMIASCPGRNEEKPKWRESAVRMPVTLAIGGFLPRGIREGPREGCGRAVGRRQLGLGARLRRRAFAEAADEVVILHGEDAERAMAHLELLGAGGIAQLLGEKESGGADEKERGHEQAEHFGERPSVEGDRNTRLNSSHV